MSVNAVYLKCSFVSDKMLICVDVRNNYCFLIFFFFVKAGFWTVAFRGGDVGNSNSIFLLPFVIIWFKNCRSAASGSLNVLKLFVCKLGYF